MIERLPAVSATPSAHEQACEAWDELVRRVAYMQSHGRIRRLLEHERQGDPLAATEAIDDVAAIRGWADDLFRAVQQLVREGAA